MPSNKLSDNNCKSAKPKDKGFKLFDGAGLFLFVTPTGGKHWRLQYRLDGKQQTMTLGSYPMVSLKEARVKADESRKAIADGTLTKKKPRAVMSFGDAVKLYWPGRQDVSQGYIDNATRALDMHVLPDIGAIDVRALTKDDLMVSFNRMNAQGLFSYVRKTRLWVSSVLDWAVAQGHADINVARLVDPEKAFGRRTVEHFAWLKPSDMGAFLQRLSLEAELNSVLACRLLMLTWVRTDELRGMRWAEIEGTLWRIPAARMKRKREHLVPLSKQALTLLERLKARRQGEFVFPNDRRVDRPMSENAVLYLLGRMGFGGVVTGHGFRTTGSTWANEAGYPPDAIERQLAHVPDDKVRAIYNQAAYLPIRAQMLQDYADWIDAQGSPPQRSALTASSLSPVC